MYVNSIGNLINIVSRLIKPNILVINLQYSLNSIGVDIKYAAKVFRNVSGLTFVNSND